MLKNYLRVLLVFFALVFFVNNCLPQAAIEWYKIYKGPWNKGYDPEQIAVDKDGNIFVTGTAVTGPFDNRTSYLDIVTIKYNPDGYMLWAISYLNPGPYADSPVSLVTDKSGNVYVTGVFQDSIDYTNNFVTLKYSSNGDLLWTRIMNNAYSYSYRKGPLIDSLSNVIVSCFDYSNNYLIKYQSNGDSLWSYTTTEYIDVTFLDKENNILIAGNDKIKKISGAGSLVWEKNIPHVIYKLNISEDNNGHYYLCGEYIDTLFLHCISRSGEVKWSKDCKKYQISSGYYFNNTQRCLVTKDGNVLLGFETVRNPGGSDIALMKFDPDGNLLWDRKYHVSDTSEQFLTELKEDARGFIYACGYSKRTGIPYNLDSNSIAILKYDPYGNLIRVTRKESLPTFLAIPKCFAIGGDDNMYIAIRNQSLTSYDYTILAKYSQPYDTLFIPVPTGYEISQNYPNPFNLTTNF
ncbi:MAG TPA: hypothetical protein VN514_02130 [Ignavibacteria bacterium]|nr:hypothetical protein [Ignavibacteria bacterium]